ncbi:MAG: dihydroxyacetone kinase subunit L [Deltaproteobacteria bacterium]|nr:dihydroxyacetone kinase subunit L [Deltaproteobacteria bacterium]
MEKIGYDEIASMFNAASMRIRENIKELSALDAATGDGDHGTTMGRAMDAVEKAVSESAGSDLKTLLYNIGWGAMCIDGGSTGPLMGSLFMGMSDAVADKESLDCEALAAMFEAGLAGVRKQTKAKVGDKTMMDALEPAVKAIREACDAGKSVPEALAAGAEAAMKGAESTKELVARFGRAKNLGERTLGHQDPGATSIALMFKGFAEAFK